MPRDLLALGLLPGSSLDCSLDCARRSGVAPVLPQDENGPTPVRPLEGTRALF